MRGFLVFGAIIFAVLGCNKALTEDATNYNLPIVHAAQRENVARANMLFTPCPLARQNVPTIKENRS